MRIKQIITLTLLLLVYASTAEAFDGKREGFSAGIGIGFSPYIHTNIHSNDYSVTNGGISMNLLLGWNFGGKDLVAFEGVLSVAPHYESFNEDGIRVYDASSSAFNGVSWYHYYKANHPSWFTVVGLGEELSNLDWTATGYGLLVGGGYEFTKQVQVGAYYSLGYTSNNRYSYTTDFIAVIISVVVY